MLLSTIENVLNIPGMNNQAAYPIPWLNRLLGAADGAVRKYCKRELALKSFVEYYTGRNQPDLVIRQRPLWCGLTLITVGSNNATLPQATINVASTSGFPAGTGGDPLATPPTLAVQTQNNTWTTVTYTGTTATSFTGCVGGTGVINTNNQVCMPAVFWDPQGYFGRTPNAFGPNTMLIPGTQFVPVLDSGGTQSKRGTIMRIAGGTGAGFIGFYPENFYSGKLGAYRVPVWPIGYGSIKVCYTAGYYPVPADLAYAVEMVVAQMARIQPLGTNVSNESLGGYSYSVLNKSEDPEIGEVRRTLAYYVESAWGSQ